MKKIALGLMAAALSISAMAQTDNNGSLQKDPQQQNGSFSKRGLRGNYSQLNLTDAQKAQIKTINEDFRQQMKDLNKQGNITVDEQKQKRQDLVKEQKDKIAAILTPEQKSQAAQMENGKAGRNGFRGDRMDNLTKDLNLTADQTAKMTSLNASFRTNIQNTRQNASLTEDQKREQMKSLMKQHKQDVEALLTNDQKEQLKSRMKNRNDGGAVK